MKWFVLFLLFKVVLHNFNHSLTRKPEISQQYNFDNHVFIPSRINIKEFARYLILILPQLIEDIFGPSSCVSLVLLAGFCLSVSGRRFCASGAVTNINCFLFQCICLQFLICFLFTCFCFCFVLSRLSAVFDLPVSLCLFGVAGCFPGKIIPSLIPFPPGSAVSTEYLNFYQILNF